MERRANSRVEFINRASLDVGNGSEMECQVKDISMAGVRVNVEKPVSECSPCTMRLHLDDDVVVEMNGTVMRYESESGDVAVHFNEGELESFQHLRKLISSNLGPADIIDNEIFNLF